MNPNSSFEEPSQVGATRRTGEVDLATRAAAQRSKTLRLAIIGLVAGTSIGYMAVSLRNGDLSWIKNLGISTAKAP